MTWATPPKGESDIEHDEAGLSLSVAGGQPTPLRIANEVEGDGTEKPRMSDRDIGRRIARAVVALALRQGFVKAISIAGAVVLARILDPATFGAYAIASFAVALFTLIGDMGLAAALIQQEHEPTNHELRVAFTAQQITLGSAAVAIWLLSTDLIRRFDLTQDAGVVVKALAIGLVVSSLRTVPSTLLERRLHFGRLAIAEGAQVVAYQGIAIWMATAGHGIVSFGIAALIATSVNTAIVNGLVRWRPGWGWDTPLLIRMLRFGLPFQGSAAISFVKDAVNPIFIGLMVGPLAVGYINWAVMVVGYPLLLVSILNRLYFPAFSRLRRDGEALSNLAGAIIRWSVFGVIGLIVPYLLEADLWTRLLFGPQWIPAVSVLYWLAIAMPFAAAASPGVAILNAFGRSHDVFVFTVVWMVATWVLTVPAVALFGWIGFGIANALVTLSAPFFFWRVQTCIRVPIWSGIAKALGAAAVAWAFHSLLLGAVPAWRSDVGAVLVVGGASSLYVATWVRLSLADVRHDVMLARGLRRSSSTATAATAGQ